MKLSGPSQIFTIDPKETETNKSVALGTLAQSPDGRLFRYAKAGSSAITAGKLQLGPARKTNHDNIAVAAAAAIGATQVTVTLGATAATANEYAEGYLVLSDATGEGTTYVIKSHPAADASASLVLTLDEPLKEALTTSSEACLVHNRFNACVEGTVQAGGIVVGVPLVDVAAGSYFWAQVWGVAAVLSDENGTVNRSVTVGSSTAGAVEEKDDMLEATDASRFDLEPIVGFQIVAMVDTEYRPVFLTIG
jgi:hypothetical protein